MNMPKRIGYLYEKMLDKEQIKQSILDCTKYKGNREEVKQVIDNIDECVDIMYEILLSCSYKPTIEYKKQIKDKSSGKIREIVKIPFFPDACLQRLAVDVMKPVLMKNMYPYSCASIPERGTKCAMKYVKHALRNGKKTKYAVKVDIRHYYPNIDADIVIEKLRKKIKDEKFLNLIYAMITSDDTPGLSIGFYINQWLANFILEEIDWKVANSDGVLYYVRNMDDMVLIGSNKRKLFKAVKMIEKELSKMGLHLKRLEMPFVIDERGLDFVGYRFYHGRVTLRRKNFRKLRHDSILIQKKHKEGKPISRKLASGFLSRAGQLKYSDSYIINKRYVVPAQPAKLRHIVRKWSERNRKDVNNGKT